MSSYPPPFDRQAWKAQQRMAKMQQQAALHAQKSQLRMQRAQWKAQQRAMRQRSMIAPLLLIAIGTVALLVETGKLSWLHVVAWYGHWWPTVLIFAGVLLIVEWLVAKSRSVPGEPAAVPAAGGGLISLLVLLAFAGVVIRAAEHHGWDGNHFSFTGEDWDQWMGDTHESDSELSSAIASGAPLLLRSPHGDVTVTGSSTDGQVHVSVHKKVRAWDDDDVSKRQDALEPKFSVENNGLMLNVGRAEGSLADVTIEVPHDTALTIESERGDVSVSQMHAPVTVTANHGNVEAQSIFGTVKMYVHYDDASLTGHSVTGPLDVEGRAGDMTFSDIDGPVTIHGDFFGSTHLEHVANTLRFQTSRTQFEAARLDGELDIANEADFNGDQLLGPVTLSTSNRIITLERVQGKLSITNRNGSVHTTSTSPFDSVSIHNEKGSVEVGVPEKAGFTLHASTRHGSVDADDFNLNSNGNDDSEETVSGTIGSGGSQVTIETTNGDVTVRKSTAEPLAPAPPAAPRITKEPVAPVAPAPPGKPGTKPAAPKAPKAPVGGDTF